MKIELTAQDSATPKLAAFLKDLESRDVLLQMGAAVNKEVQNNFLRRESRGNRLGGPSQQFYAKAARHTNYRVVGNVAIVSVNQLGILQRLLGGDITPGKTVSRYTGELTKYLAIPARAEAYGKKAGEFGDLEVLWGSHGRMRWQSGNTPMCRLVVSARMDRERSTKVKSTEWFCIG